MKVFTLAANENWICDRFSREWGDNNKDISTNNILEADAVWLIAGWCWNHISHNILKEKKVVLTIHHIVPEKFTEDKIREFLFRDQFVDMYHVPCRSAAVQIENLTKKPIFQHPFWANQDMWFEISDKAKLREKYDLSGKYVVGSFQRDTEGSDLISPKLEKGPDLFCDLVENMIKDKPNIHVLLAGWRRQYVINRLSHNSIPYTYIELPDLDIVNELYNCLDLYVVASRCEGGPQSIVECALTKTPIISTNVGLAPLILSEASIFNKDWRATPDIEFANKQVQKLKIPGGFEPFRKMLLELG
jgi:glycosyltransferase involved in cell wall biosynthesis